MEEKNMATHWRNQRIITAENGDIFYEIPVSTCGQITIPKLMRDRIGIKNGCIVNIMATETEIRISSAEFNRSPQTTLDENVTPIKCSEDLLDPSISDKVSVSPPSTRHINDIHNDLIESITNALKASITTMIETLNAASERVILIPEENRDKIMEELKILLDRECKRSIDLEKGIIVAGAYPALPLEPPSLPENFPIQTMDTLPSVKKYVRKIGETTTPKELVGFTMDDLFNTIDPTGYNFYDEEEIDHVPGEEIFDVLYEFIKDTDLYNGSKNIVKYIRYEIDRAQIIVREPLKEIVIQLDEKESD
jgi:bifunctional DNA-binding transcriptional regulator/antitoxin component of YhaV-PrlF toxin-antitoxin module